MWSPLRREALARARVSRGKYKCETCKELVGPKEIDIDHIQRITPEGGINEPEDWGILIRRLLHCGLEGLVAMCKPCHKLKTAEERNAKKPIKKKTRKKTKKSK